MVGKRSRSVALGGAVLLAASLLAAAQGDAEGSAQFQPLGEPGIGGRLTAISIQPAGDRMLVGGDMLGVAHSDDGGASWRPSTGLLAYEMADFTWDPLVSGGVWVGSMSGPHWSTDGGATFAPQRDGMGPLGGYPYTAPVQRIVYLADGDTVLAFGGSQRTWSEDNGQPTNYGDVWVATRNGGGWSAWTRRSELPGNIVTAARSGPVLYALVRGGTAGVYRSEDDGVTWSRASAPEGVHDELTDLAVHPDAPGTLWVTRSARSSRRSVVPGAVYRSDDGGTTWVRQGPVPDTSGNVDQVTSYAAIEASATVPQGMSAPMLYASDVGQDVKTTYRSADGGQSWQPVLDPPSLTAAVRPAYSGGADFFTLAVDPSDPFLMVGGSQEHLVAGRSTGPADDMTWRDLASEQLGGGAYRGRGFTGLVATRISFNPFAPGMVALNAMDGGNLLLTRDGGQSWSRPLAGAQGRTPGTEWMDAWMGAVDTTFADANTIYVLKGQIGWFAGIAKSSDGGQSWQILERSGNGLPIGMDFQQRGVTAIQALRAGEVVFTMDGCLWRTRDGGNTWAKERKSCSLGLGDLARDPGSTDAARLHLFAQGTAGVYESIDGGLTFKLLTNGNRGALSPGAPAGDGRLTVAARAGGGLDVYATSTQTAQSGLYRWDGATTGWTRLAASAGGVSADTAAYLYDVAVDPTNPNRIATVAIDFPYHDQTWGVGALVSEDRGATWRIENNGLGVLRAAAVGWDPSRPGRLVVGTYGQGFAEIQL